MKKITKTEIKCLSWSIKMTKTEKISKKLNKKISIKNENEIKIRTQLEKTALSMFCFTIKTV